MNYRQKKVIKKTFDSFLNIFFATIIVVSFGFFVFGIINLLYGIEIPIWQICGMGVFVLICLYNLFKIIYYHLYRFFVIYNFNEEDYKRYLFNKSVPEDILKTKAYKIYKFCGK